MDTNINQILQPNDTTTGIFYIQSLNYKKHFENLVKNFYPTKDIIPKGNFNALELIETYFPDIASQYNKPTEHHTLTHTTSDSVRTEKQPPTKKTKKMCSIYYIFIVVDCLLELVELLLGMSWQWLR